LLDAAEAAGADAPADGAADDDWHGDGESAFDGTLGGAYGGEYMAPDSVTDRLVTGTGMLELEDEVAEEDRSAAPGWALRCTVTVADAVSGVEICMPTWRPISPI
jgi:hypothetical protein